MMNKNLESILIFGGVGLSTAIISALSYYISKEKPVLSYNQAASLLIGSQIPLVIAGVVALNSLGYNRNKSSQLLVLE